MTRPVSSEIRYPFVPSAPLDQNIRWIRDLVIVVHSPVENPEDPVTVAGMTEPFVSLRYIAGGGSVPPVTYRFVVYTPSGTGTNEFYYSYVEFEITSDVDGFGAVTSADGYSTLFGMFSQLVFPDVPLVFPETEYIVEPCCVKWLHNNIPEVAIINEYRHYDPTKRIQLINTILKTFLGSVSSRIKFGDGYNVALSVSENDLQFLGSPGAGEGLAPGNMWDVGPPDELDYYVKSINGAVADGEGRLEFEVSESLLISIVDDVITITDSSDPVGRCE